MAFCIKHSTGMSGFIHLFIFHVSSKTIVMTVAVDFYGRQSVSFTIAFSMLLCIPSSLGVKSCQDKRQESIVEMLPDLNDVT
jgi:hypothetical protein